MHQIFNTATRVTNALEENTVSISRVGRDITPQKTAMLISTAVRISDLTFQTACFLIIICVYYMMAAIRQSKFHQHNPAQ